jgi:hypothetical protein
MSRLLVLGAGKQARRWSRLLVGRTPSSARDREAQCEALVVVNDRSARSVADLQQALDLRRQRPGLPLAILTLVDANANDTQALADALSLPAEDGRARVSAAQGEALLKVLVSEDGTSFEYQGYDPKRKLQ